MLIFRFIAVNDAEFEAFALDPDGVSGRDTWLVDIGKGLVPAEGVRIYRYIDQSDRIRVNVQLFGPKAAEDDNGIITHPTRIDGEGSSVRIVDSKMRVYFRDQADNDGAPRVRITIDRKQDGVTWVTGAEDGIQIARGVTLVGDEFDGIFDNPLLVEHAWL